MFYDRNEDGVPHEWARRMKLALRHISPQFNCWRMVREYMSELYGPAHEGGQAMRANDFEAARKVTQWNEHVGSVWNQVHFVEIGPEPEGPVLTGAPVPLRALVDLAGLSPADIRVEAVVGRVGTNGQLEDTQVVRLRPSGERGQAHEFEERFVPDQTGRLGYSLRLSPNHYDNPLTRPCNSPIKWGGE